MELNKTFKITFWAKKHKKHITRNAKWTELCRYFTSKDGVPCMTYYDLDNDGYRTATTTWRVQLLELENGPSFVDLSDLKNYKSSWDLHQQKQVGLKRGYKECAFLT
jgi:hypothetical protein